MFANFRPSWVSRNSVQVAVRDSMSDSPLASAVKRTALVTDWNSTLLGSPKIAVATARQIETSLPDQLPF